MYKIATITFHHAHNFGSVLQTYALQEFVRDIFYENGYDIEYRVIDFYTKKQKELYNVFKTEFNVKNIVKNIIACTHKKSLVIRYNKFETFLKENVSLTKRYVNEEELEAKAPIADLFISGSDQIWNVRAQDFSDAYFLDFVNQSKKISYAASFGPLKINWSKYNSDKYKELLGNYYELSVRENASAKNIEYLTGKKCSVNVDPTLLLDVNKWRKIQSHKVELKGKYILLYCLEPSKKQLKIARMISRNLQLPIVVLQYNNKNDMFNHFIKRYDAGPKDFLAYIDHAALVLTSSFHGTAFSLLYHKPFYILDNSHDERILHLLESVKLKDRFLDNIGDLHKVDISTPNYVQIDSYLREQKNISKKYLCDAIGLKNERGKTDDKCYCSSLQSGKISI